MKTPKKVASSEEVVTKTPKISTETPKSLKKKKNALNTPVQAIKMKSQNTPQNQSTKKNKNKGQDKSINETPNKSPDQEQNGTPGKKARKRNKSKGKKDSESEENTSMVQQQSGEKNLNNSPPKNTQQNQKEGITEAQIYFPYGASNYKSALENVIKLSDTVGNPRVLITKYKSSEAAAKAIEAIKKITIEGKELRYKLFEKEADPLKRVCNLKPMGADTELVKNHFGATEIVQCMAKGRPKPLHFLTFATEKDAIKACDKSLTLDGREVTLRPCFKQSFETMTTSPAIKRKSNEMAESKEGKKAKKAKSEAVSKVVEEEEEEDDDDDDEEEMEGDEEEEEEEAEDDEEVGEEDSDDDE